MKNIFFILLLAFLCGCKSYKFAPNGYLVKGDDEFVSVDHSLMVYLGEAVLEDENWHAGIPAANTNRLSRKATTLLRTFGYDKHAYALLFDGKIVDTTVSFQCIALTNTHGVYKEGGDNLLDMGRLKLQKLNDGKWYVDSLSLNDEKIYHVVIPVSEKLWSEKYLSLLFVFKEGDRETQHYIQDLIYHNAMMYKQQGTSFFTYKLIEICDSDADKVYYDYEIPEKLRKNEKYALVKMFKKQDGAEKLAFYTLISLQVKLGAFKICKGNYRMVCSTLYGKELWEQNVSIQ